MPLMNSGSAVRRRRRRRSRLTGKNIGVLSPTPLASPYQELLLNALRAAASVTGSHLTFGVGVSQPIDLSLTDAVLCIGSPRDERVVESISRGDLPAVMMTQDAQELPLDAVRQDNERGGYLMLRHLIKTGYTDFAIVAGPSTCESANDRLHGAIRACRRYNLGDPRIVVVGGYIAQGGAAATRTILSDRRRPGAIFYMNDEMALAGREVLREDGLLEDIAIAGYDDIPGAEAAELTTIQSPVNDLATVALELLDRRIAHPDRAVQTVTLRPRLIVRSSCVLT